MNSLTDQQLLRDYTGRLSEAAFAELVRRHVDFVYSAALRMVRDAHLAEDVTQSVFVALAQKARQLTDHAVLSGWLHRTTQNLAANAVRADVRRRAREQEAAAMNELLSAEPDAVWEHIAPQLDEALGELNEGDHDALLLRYFERKSAREMAQTLGTSEDAAQKRVNRAVERLREFFAKRGITVGTSGLVVVITANAVQAAPVGLAATIATAAALAGTALATTATATKAIAMTTLQKTLITAALTAAIGTGIYETHQNSQLRDQVQTLQQQQGPLSDQLRQLQQEREDAKARQASLLVENEQLKSNQNAAELLKLRGEVTQLRNEANDQASSAAKVWLAKVNKLKLRLEETPAAKIPELQFLTEQDWLNATKGSLDTEAHYRRALALLRNAAETKFSGMYQQALKKYLDTNTGQFPTDVSLLQSYFDPAIDEAILQRWKLIPANNKAGNQGLGGDWILTEKAPVDELFDTRHSIGLHGSGSTDFFFLENGKTLAPLYQAFDTANPNHGPEAPNASQLLPYATTPEQQASIQKLILRESVTK